MKYGEDITELEELLLSVIADKDERGYLFIHDCSGRLHNKGMARSYGVIRGTDKQYEELAAQGLLVLNSFNANVPDMKNFTLTDKGSFWVKRQVVEQNIRRQITDWEQPAQDQVALAQRVYVTLVEKLLCLGDIDEQFKQHVR